MNKLDAFWEFARYVINGLAATAVHYGVLTFNLKVLDLPSAGLANFFAAIVGIAASFLGSRYFVFRQTEVAIYLQAVKFSGLYGLIAVLHGFILFFWSDWLGLNYTIGFLIATVVQVLFSYLGNKRLVFNV